MATPLKFAGLLLISTALTVPAVAIAQDVPAPSADAAAMAGNQPAVDSAAAAAGVEQEEEAPDVSLPGGEIVVVGRRGANIQRSAPAVVSVLSAADIARTGEGNIAGALGRVTGLSVVGNGFVYVRGLGDRYSLALLNGLPLPSPEPLKRVVPLDIFPTNIVSSSLVQKSYSPNFPGEFGGGVINLTTNAVPKESFLTFSGGVGGNSETTTSVGYVHYGAKTDWTGFDNGSRGIPPALAAYFASGQRMNNGGVNTQAIGGQLINSRNALIQRWDSVAPNWSGSVSGGTSFDLGGDFTLGLIATAGYSNKWQTRDAIQQFSVSSDLSTADTDFERVTTDNRIVVNGLFGLGLEFGDNKVRWTNLYIRDTLKNTRLGVGTRNQTETSYMQQDTAWYERQLIDTQVVGEFKLTPELSIDLRGSYANSQREAPSELSIEYVKTNAAADPYGAYYVNRLDGNRGNAEISYSDLNEDLYAFGADVSYRVIPDLSVSAGYAYLRTKRVSSRRDFQFRAPSTFPGGVDMFRPDHLLAPNIIDYFDIALVEDDSNPAFDARLFNHAGYGKLNWQITPEILIDAGVRYETAKQVVSPLQVFSVPSSSTASTRIENEYWLPAATVTWQVQPDMQVRVNASKTIARPQFRELIFQYYFDPDTNRQYQGNPLLQDSKLFNAEARYEWYFAREQRVSVAGFYKKIDNPIEPFSFILADRLVTSFANAPTADLYGGEFEVTKYFDGSNLSDSAFFDTRRIVLIANYTYTKSKLKVKPGDVATVYGASSTNATDFFRDGAALTGQSDHLINFQVGFEDTDKLSQQTLIMSYASKRVTSRGIANQDQPDVYEYPGFNLDFVARQGVNLAGRDVDVKFEARNLTNRKYKEMQSNGTNSVFYNLYNLGITVNLSLSTTF
jgi:TonB-dependent receptor